MPDNYWPNPLQLFVLKDAVDRREQYVEIDGKKFMIRYEEKTFFIKPVDGFVPCGYFEYASAFDEIM